MPGIKVTISGQDALLRKLQLAPAYITEATRIAAYEVQQFTLELIRGTFAGAAANAGGAFPSIYTEHLLETVSAHEPIVSISGETFSVIFNLEALGNFEDLNEGAHYRAQLAGGGEVELPYTGEPLKNDADTRYIFWLTMVTSQRAPGMPPPPPGAEEETYAARVTYWESKGVAPQWLLLNYGVGSYPVIHPFPIVETINSALAIEGKAIFEAALIAAAQRIAGQETRTGAIATVSQEYKRTYNRDARGRFTRRV